jgi:hypothetical protein
MNTKGILTEVAEKLPPEATLADAALSDLEQEATET